MDWMLEQRDHHKIRINILENNPDTTPSSLSAAQTELAELEQDILRHKPPIL
jgi:endonuclease/exonuclease/phosphatase (EEP) superfamily protein YafD